MAGADYWEARSNRVTPTTGVVDGDFLDRVKRWPPQPLAALAAHWRAVCDRLETDLAGGTEGGGLPDAAAWLWTPRWREQTAALASAADVPVLSSDDAEAASAALLALLERSDPLTSPVEAQLGES